jgi:hypothetical protein
MTALFCRGARIAPARDVIILAWASYVSLCRRTAGKPLVGKRVRQSFENVNNHNYDELLEAVAPHVHHRFAGAYSIGGARNGYAGAASASGRLNFRRRT